MVPVDEGKKLKNINKEKLKSKFKSDLSNIPIAKLGSRRITRSMISSASITPLWFQDSSLIKILSEEEYYYSMDLYSQEHEDKIDNPVASPNVGFDGSQSPILQNDTEIKRGYSFTNDSS